AGGSALFERTAATAAVETGLSHAQSRWQPRAWRQSGDARRACRRARHCHQWRQGGAHLPARRSRRALWRSHGTDERSAPGRLSQSRFGRNGAARGEMTALALPWFEDEDPRDLRRWAIAAAIVFAIHVGAVGGSVVFHLPGGIHYEEKALAIVTTFFDFTVALLSIAPVPRLLA